MGNSRNCRCDCCFEWVKGKLSRAFTAYGKTVGRHPLPFIILPVLVFGGLGAGLLTLEQETDMEVIYFPKDSQSLDQRQTMRDTFPDRSQDAYNAFSQNDVDEACTLIFTASGSVLSNAALTEISALLTQVKALTSTESGTLKTFTEVCAKSQSNCYVDGEQVLSAGFQTALGANQITYPVWNPGSGDVDLARNLADVETQGGNLVSAKVLLLSVKLTRTHSNWKTKFLEWAADVQETLKEVKMTYSTPESLNDELDKSTTGDIIFFSLTITLCCTYASLVTIGGDCVSTRSPLAFAGILAAGLGILGAMGLMSLCGVKFVNIVGVVPFLIIGIGVDDMFLLMSAFSESVPTDLKDQDKYYVPTLLGKTFAKAGVGITITSLTDFLAFAIGAASVFRSVTYFSLYAGVAVLFCYIANATFFGGCLSVHAHRVYRRMHGITLRVTKTKDELREEQKSACVVHCCGGSVPKDQNSDRGPMERFPGWFLPKVIEFKFPLGCILILLFFCGYLAAAIYGCFHLKQGLILQDLVLDTSYYYDFLQLSDQYFPTTIPLGFVVESQVDYFSSQGQQFLDFMTEAKKDTGVDDSFQRCWLSAYKNSGDFTNSAADFIPNLRTFLNANAEYQPDVIFDSSNSTVVASRCFLLSKPNSDQYSNSELMTRMRSLADGSSLPVFVYHSSFVAFEQFLAVLPATMLLTGCALAVMTVVTFLLLPNLLMVILVMVTILMILIGIFGFMHYWDLTLSSVTMIHLVMSVGFSVDFSAHVCAAFLMSDKQTSRDRAEDAITHAAGPILNGACSTLIGILLLAFSSSFIFISFFRIMLMVIIFGLLHAVFFLPAVLALVGPSNRSPANVIHPSLQPETGTTSAKDVTTFNPAWVSVSPSSNLIDNSVPVDKKV